jgi:hypothetical protein
MNKFRRSRKQRLKRTRLTRRGGSGAAEEDITDRSILLQRFLVNEIIIPNKKIIIQYHPDLEGVLETLIAETYYFTKKNRENFERVYKVPSNSLELYVVRATLTTSLNKSLHIPNFPSIGNIIDIYIKSRKISMNDTIKQETEDSYAELTRQLQRTPLGPNKYVFEIIFPCLINHNSISFDTLDERAIDAIMPNLRMQSFPFEHLPGASVEQKISNAHKLSHHHYEETYRKLHQLKEKFEKQTHGLPYIISSNKIALLDLQNRTLNLESVLLSFSDPRKTVANAVSQWVPNSLSNRFSRETKIERKDVKGVFLTVKQVETEIKSNKHKMEELTGIINEAISNMKKMREISGLTPLEKKFLEDESKMEDEIRDETLENQVKRLVKENIMLHEQLELLESGQRGFYNPPVRHLDQDVERERLTQHIQSLTQQVDELIIENKRLDKDLVKVVGMLDIIDGILLKSTEGEYITQKLFDQINKEYYPIRKEFTQYAKSSYSE